MWWLPRADSTICQPILGCQPGAFRGSQYVKLTLLVWFWGDLIAGYVWLLSLFQLKFESFMFIVYHVCENVCKDGFGRLWWLITLEWWFVMAGEGGFGHVVLCVNKLDGRRYAMKKIRLKVKTLSQNNKILRYVHFQSNFVLPNFTVRLWGIVRLLDDNS